MPKLLTSHGTRASTRGIHGQYQTPEYKTWVLMRRRCRASNHDSFARYGARGIRVCPRWESFMNFLADMGPKPSPRHSIERRNTYGNYEPDNCYWATSRQQANNRTSNHLVIYRNQCMTLREALRMAGDIVEKSTALRRVSRLGWSVARAVETPAAKQKNNTARRP